jgi:hypothetical protein
LRRPLGGGLKIAGATPAEIPQQAYEALPGIDKPITL